MSSSMSWVSGEEEEGEGEGTQHAPLYLLAGPGMKCVKYILFVLAAYCTFGSVPSLVLCSYVAFSTR